MTTPNEYYNPRTLESGVTARAEDVNRELNKLEAAFEKLPAPSAIADTGGQPNYTHIAFADTIDGTSNFTTGDPGSRAFIGFAANQPSATASEVPEDYLWARFRGADGADGEDGAAGEDIASTTATLTHAPYTNSVYIGSITGNTLTVATGSLSTVLTPIGAYGGPEVGQALSSLTATLPDDLEIIAEVTPWVANTSGGGTAGVYTLNQTLASPIPSGTYFLANKPLEEERRPVAKVYSDRQSIDQWGTTGQNDSGDEAKIVKALSEKRIGSDLFFPAGEYTITASLLHDRDGNLVFEHGTRINLRVAKGNAIPALKIDHRYSRLGSENRGQGIYGHGGGIAVYNTSTGSDADTYDGANKTQAKAGSYAIAVNEDLADSDAQQVVRYTIDNVSMVGGASGALHLKGGNPGVNAYPEVYWCLVRNCPSIEGTIFDECSDGNSYEHNNFVGSYQPAMTWKKIQGAFNNYAAHNTSSCRNGFLFVRDGAMWTAFDNQIELAGSLENESTYSAQITIAPESYPCFRPRIIANNFGTGALNPVALAMIGDVRGAVLAENYWNMYCYTPGDRYDLLLDDDVRDIVWMPGNRFRGIRIGPAADSVGSLAALKATPVTGGSAIHDLNYDGSRWFFFLDDMSAYSALVDDIDYVLADGVPITTGLWMRSIVDPDRRPRGTMTDRSRMLRVGFHTGASLANINPHQGLILPVTGQMAFNGTGGALTTGIELLRDLGGHWNAEGYGESITLSGASPFSFPAWAAPPFEHQIMLQSNGAAVFRALGTDGAVADGTAFGAATVYLDNARWPGLSEYDYDVGP